MEQTFERIERHLYKRQYQISTGEWSTLFYAKFTDWKGKLRTFPLGSDLQGARDRLGVLHKRNDAEYEFDAEAEKKKRIALTFSTWADECMMRQKAGTIITRSRKRPKESTLERELASISVLKKYFGELPLSEITIKKIPDYQPWRTSQNLVRCGKAAKGFVSLSCVANELACLRKYLRYANNMGLIAAVPAMTLPEKGRATRLPNNKEFEKLIEVSPIWLRRIVIVAAETCLSEADVLRLDDSMVDENEGVLVPEGGRAKTGVLQVAPITPKVRAVLEDIKRERKMIANISKLIFTRNGKPITKGILQGAFASAAKKAGIQGFTFHGLRHLAKTRWARAGIPVEVAMLGAGHASVQMHQHYVHLQRGDVAKAFKMFTGCLRENGGEERDAASH